MLNKLGTTHIASSLIETDNIKAKGKESQIP